ncbi:MAG TPA: hypothetical protein VK428_01895 [Acidimicrobiales bacterium]|nr:hypothetical protein [Acidimicrobiales bacterium]
MKASWPEEAEGTLELVDAVCTAVVDVVDELALVVEVVVELGGEVVVVVVVVVPVVAISGEIGSPDGALVVMPVGTESLA